MSDAFEWDPDKAAYNEAKHGITFKEATSVFLDPLVQNEPDDDHSLDEERYTAIGLSQVGRLVIVTYTGSWGSNPDHQRTQAYPA